MHVLILGSRGVPACHGGFETFAEDLSLFLVSRGHQVTVYCQADASSAAHRDSWRGVQRVHLPAPSGAVGTVLFDLRAVWDSLRQPGVVLVLGYNTAIFSLLYRLTGRASLMNMDGLEWKREKWSGWQRAWLRINESLGAWLSTHLIADHPEIGKRLQTLAPRDKISIIPYGADAINESDEKEIEEYLTPLGILPNRYALVIARLEPENSIREIVQAFSSTARGMKLVILGQLRATNAYHRQIVACASGEVLFPGAIYDRTCVEILRRNARVYLHGHRVGGTNPSLVGALAAGNAVIAHDNVFTRWVAGTDAGYFSNAIDLAATFDCLLEDEGQLSLMRGASQRRHNGQFTQAEVLSRYEELLQRFVQADR